MNVKEKKRIILSKIKEQWDLSPKYSYNEPLHFGYGRIIQAREVRVAGSRFDEWCQEANLQYFEFKNILEIFKQEGLIENYEFMDESR